MRTCMLSNNGKCILLYTRFITSQISVLDEAARVHPDTWWWIKADGVDLVSGLGESVRGVWSGDVDLADGSLKKAYDAHQTRLMFVKRIGVETRSDSSIILKDLMMLEQLVMEDLKHISACKFLCCI